MSTPLPATAPPATDPPVHLPSPPSERGAWLLAGTIGLLGVAVLLAVLTGLVGRTPADAPPAVPAVALTPVAGATAAASALAAVRGSPAPAGAATAATGATTAPAVAGGPGAGRVLDATEVRIARSWMEGFYPIYAAAQGTFGVNWLLLASIHMQESAFSTAPGTYRGLNFAHCCGGPMQFNVTNGRVTTWDLVADSYRYGRRPASYDHRTAGHPSIYDDFDSIMAAAHLLSAGGAGFALDGTAWAAAYAYYGHDATGVVYADHVLARAIGWSQHGFCANCGVDAALVQAVHVAYGAPVAATLTQAPPTARAARTAHAARRP
jgi:hypothetical protein